MAFAAGAQRAEWRQHWPIVFAAFVGFSFPVVPFLSLGLFLEPMGRELGWSRTLITAGGSLGAAIIIPLAPVFGAIVDRWGVRRVALPGFVVAIATMGTFGLADKSAALWLSWWGVYALSTLALKSTVWTLAVSDFFTAGRSLAIAVVLSGSAFASMVAPPLVRWLIDSYGWREAYLYLALFWGGATLLVNVFLLRDAPGRTRRPAPGGSVREPSAASTSSAAATSELQGLSVKEAMRSIPLIRIGLATLIILVLGSTLTIHKVPILTAAGVSREMAANLASLSGLAGIIGGITTGWLMQRFDAGWVGGLTNALMALALVLLLEPFRSPASIVASMIVVGYAGGTKVEICAYLTTVYGGLRNYGKIFGVMASIIAVSGAIAPTFGSLVYDLTGDYDLLILWGIPVSLISGLLLVRLGPFPEWSRAHEPGRRRRPALAE